MFGRATIRLGIGPHSSYIFFAIDDVIVTSVNTEYAFSYYGGLMFIRHEGRATHTKQAEKQTESSTKSHIAGRFLWVENLM